MLYPMIRPPLEFESFAGMSREQAQRYFDWYIASIPERVKTLDECFNDVWGCSIRFDYSLESLGSVWEGFENRVEDRTPSEEETDAERARIRASNLALPEPIVEKMASERVLTVETMIIALDIAAYFGETLARNLPGIHWGFFTKPKDLHAVNRPVLRGFRFKNGREDYMDPTNMVIVACYKSLKQRNPRYLTELVEIWREYLPEQV